MDLFFDVTPHLEYFSSFFEFSTKAAFAKAAFDTFQWMRLFLLTVGSFLLTVELFYLQLTILAFSLTIGAFLLTILASSLTVGAFLLTVGKCV